MKKRIVIKSKRKFIAALTLFLVVLTVFAAFTFNIAIASSETGEPVYEEYVVHHGDTLWSIASEFKADNCDTRAYVNKVMSINGLESSQIYPNQILLLPQA